MARHFILAQSPVTARALGAWLELVGEGELATDENKLTDPRVLWSKELPTGTSKHLFVQRLIRILEKAREEAAPEPAIVLVDSVRPLGLNPLSTSCSWDSVLASLILALPEVRWVFGTITQQNDENENLFPNSWHNLVSLFKPDFDPLFDSTGLRQFVRNNCDAKQGPWIPRRKTWALAMDEEPMFAYLHGYIAYRFGFRAFPVHSYQLANELLEHPQDEGISADCASGLGPPALTMEDLYLGFPDRPDNNNESSAQRLANLKTRSKTWRVLNHEHSHRSDQKMPWRYFISSGHTQSGGVENVADNEVVMDILSEKRRGGRKVGKPISGIFALWRELNLFNRLPCPDGKPEEDEYPGYAPEFQWPPTRDEALEESSQNHSAPGQLLIIAESLIDRAEKILGSANSIREAVRGAVLATSALELLGPKTPTTARDALELKHRFEVCAECQFGGVQYNIEVKDRFREIRRDVQLLGRWYGQNARASAIHNAELTIISRLRAIFRAHDEFDEEDQCLKRIRDLQRKIWTRRFLPWSLLGWPVRFYLEKLVGSFALFLGTTILWILGLVLFIGFQLQQPASPPATFAPSIAKHFPDFSENDRIRIEAYVIDNGNVPKPPAPNAHHHSWELAFRSFFGGEPTVKDINNTWITLAGVLGAFVGFLHLGVLISRLYDLINRR
ncbi:MAG: hypothetical protein ACFE0O_04525 [Opitutales bacterium]